MPAKETANGGQDRWRKEVPGESGLKHERINHVTAALRDTPSFESADDYRRVRLELIPLRRRDKAPADRRWQERAYDHGETLARAKRDGLNLGVRLPPDVVVVDVDPRNFPPEIDCLAELAQEAGLDLRAAPHVLTCNLEHPCHHFYFRKPAGVALLESVEGFAA